jgi:uncharacterized protein YeaO (DUF488 family)
VVRLKRAYEPADASDGRRILVDRLWPRGLSKRKLAIDEWMKELSPSSALRRWFQHDPRKWLEFRRRYKRELRQHARLVDQLARWASRRRVTLVFGARDEVHNDAVVLADVIRARMKRPATRPRAKRR